MSNIADIIGDHRLKAFKVRSNDTVYKHILIEIIDDRVNVLAYCSSLASAKLYSRDLHKSGKLYVIPPNKWCPWIL